MANEVFISYSHDDKTFVDRLAADLTSRGIAIWVDKHIEPGESWDSSVQRALGQSECFMVVLSLVSIYSRHVKNEIIYALNTGKPVIPILINQVKDSDIPVQITSLERINFWKSYEEGLAQLIALFQRYGFTIRTEAEPASEKEGDRSEELEEYYTQAEGSFLLKKWDKAIANYQAIVNINPNYLDAAKKLDQARRALGHETYYKQALIAMGEKKWEQAIGLITKIHLEAPDYEDTEALLARAREQKSFVDLYEQAQRYAANEEWQEVVATLDKISIREPRYPDPLSLRKNANEKLNERKAKELYRLAIEEMKVKNNAKAYELLKQVSKINPNYSDTRSLMQKIENEDRGIKPPEPQIPKYETPIREEPAEPVAPPQKTEKKPISNVIILVGAGVLIGVCSCCGLLYLLLNSGSF